MIDFPASPSSGQIFSSGGVSWIFNGVAWGSTMPVTYSGLGGFMVIGPTVDLQMLKLTTLPAPFTLLNYT